MYRIWHDVTVRNLPLWLAISGINVSVLLGLLFWRRAHEGDLEIPLAPLFGIFWLAVALYLLFGKPESRGHQLELTLPIPTRDLWWRHISGTLLGALLVLATSFAVLALHAWMIHRAEPRTELAIPFWSLVGPLLAALLLATVLVDSIGPGLWKPRVAPRYWLKTLSWLVAVLILLLALGRWPAIAVILCTALSIVVLRRNLRSLPTTYRLVPTRLAAARQAGTLVRRVAGSPDRVLAGSVTDPVGRWQVVRIVFDVLHTAPPWKRFAPWLLYFFVALIGFVLSGGPGRWIDIADLRFLYLPFGSYMLVAGLGVLTYHLHRLDPLPISRATIFAVLTMPGLVIYCVGYGAGLLTLATDPSPAPLVDYHVEAPRDAMPLQTGPDEEPRELMTMVWVEVDPSFMGLSLDGEVPMLTSPWGESHRAWSEAIFPGLPLLVYNPYNTAGDTSADFEALLTSRAIEDVYGRSIPPDEIRDRYFALRDGRVAGFHWLERRYEAFLRERPDHGLDEMPMPEFGRVLQSDYPGLTSPAKGSDTPVYMALVLVPWLLLTAFIVGSFRATRSNRYIRWTYWVALGILMGAMLAQVVLALFGLFSPEAARTALAILIRRLGAEPLSQALSWAVSLGLIALSYRFALRRFERAELPAAPINCSFVDWGAEK